jgi:hypothetical protein
MASQYETTLTRAPQRRTGEPRVEVTSVGWQADVGLDYEDWLRYGSRLGLAGRNAAWWVGDWVRYGTARYGSKYSAAARVTGYDRQTLMNYVYVANRFDISRRRENLSWSHHAELAALDLEGQERWLERSGSERLTVRDLREALSGGSGRTRSVAAQTTSPSAEEPDPSEPQVMICPHCGEEFTPAS